MFSLSALTSEMLPYSLSTVIPEAFAKLKLKGVNNSHVKTSSVHIELYENIIISKVSCFTNKVSLAVEL